MVASATHATTPLLRSQIQAVKVRELMFYYEIVHLCVTFQSDCFAGKTQNPGPSYCEVTVHHTLLKLNLSPSPEMDKIFVMYLIL